MNKFSASQYEGVTGAGFGSLDFKQVLPDLVHQSLQICVPLRLLIQRLCRRAQCRGITATLLLSSARVNGPIPEPTTLRSHEPSRLFYLFLDPTAPFPLRGIRRMDNEPLVFVP